MTLLLKSNVLSTANLGNIWSYGGPLDFRAMLSFEREIYQKDGVSFSFSDALDFSRSTEGSYTDRNGVIQTAAAGVPRIHNTPEGKKGLLLEPVLTNQFANPNTPATQTVTMTLHGNQQNNIFLRVLGTGSATLSVADILHQTPSLIATEGNPVVATLGAVASKSVTVTISGSVSYVELFNLGQFYGGPREPQRIPTAVTQASEDFASIKSSFLGDILSEGQGTVVLGWTKGEDLVPAAGYGINYGGAVNLANPRGGVYIYPISRSSLSVHGINDGTTGRAIGGTTPNTDARNVTVGMAWSDGILRGSNNGLVQEWSDTFTAPEVDTINLAPNSLYSASYRASGTLKFVAIYDRILTVAELRAATLSGLS